MRRVLILGSDFLPSTYPPALRIRNFVRYLPEFGWQPTVLTVDPRHYEWRVDLTMSDLMPLGVEVVRTPALPVRLTRKVGIGDLGIRSLWPHWREVSRLCADGRVDLVFIPVPPYVPMVLGRLAHTGFGVPYVVDYIDPWVTDYYFKLPRKQRPPKWALAYAVSRLLEPVALRRVAHLTGVSRGTTDLVKSRYPWLADVGATEIPYGGEPSDFELLRRRPRRNVVFDPSDGRLHLTSVGRGGPDLVPALTALLRGLRLVIERSPDISARVRVHFVGTTYAVNSRGAGPYQVLPLARRMGVDGWVHEHPQRIPYLDALQIMLDSHALLALGSEEGYYTASKIFPYVLSRRPVLAVFHEASSVVDILRESGAGEVVTFRAGNSPEEKAEEIAARLERLLRLPPDYEPPTRWEAFEAYTARAMTARLAEAFEQALRRAGRTSLGSLREGCSSS
ncbi:MAG: hypothetical protein KatS3mg082_3129 [Nitrospiraceae bacterium]|nr:MAG: hypothetical protein KatS3mg082_3129 [Nitrospiraceae bacterium]